MMSRVQMNRQMKHELDHIPDWPGEHQGELRMLCNAERRRSLGRDSEGLGDARDVMRRCVASICERHPGAVANYDRAFFGE